MNGAKPGERRGGRARGAKNKSTIQRERLETLVLAQSRSESARQRPDCRDCCVVCRHRKGTEAQAHHHVPGADPRGVVPMGMVPMVPGIVQGYHALPRAAAGPFTQRSMRTLRWRATRKPSGTRAHGARSGVGFGEDRRFSARCHPPEYTGVSILDEMVDRGILKQPPPKLMIEGVEAVGRSKIKP